MPVLKRSEGWFRSEDLVLPRQTLAPDEVEPFLDYLFSSVARKPKPLKLKETAGVVRYLKALALQDRHPAERRAIERIAEILWGTVMQSGRIAMAGKSEVIKFLQEHRHTYFAHTELHRMLDLIGQEREPANAGDLFRPPRLLGKRRSVSGAGPARLQDDLTERIYAGYHALRRAKVRNARGRIAEVLNRLGFQTRPRSAAASTWGPAEVNDRVQQFEARLVHQHRLSNKGNRSKEITRLRNMQVDSWIHGFHHALKLNSESPESSGT